MKKILFTVLIAAISTIAFAQWSDNPAENNRITPLGTEIYDYDIKKSNNGTAFIAFNRPVDGNTATFFQIVDVNGNMLFPEEGVLISNKPTLSYTMAGELLFVDDDDNAIIVVTDCRNSTASDISYTLYKVSPTGEMLWGNEGVDLCNGMAYGFVADIKIVQLEDGTYVCAWMVETSNLYIQLQRISKTGELLWNEEEMRLFETSAFYEHPYLVSTGNNEVLVVYARGTNMFNKVIKARKIGSNGASVWAQDMNVYSNGGFGFTPLWLIIRVIPDQMGGAFVGWFDDRDMTWTESTYIAHIKADGTHGLPAGELGLKIGHSSLRSFYPEMYFNNEEGALYVTWRETNDTQSWQQMKAQKIKVPSGELMWGENGKDIYPLTQNHAAAFYSIQGGENDNVAIFFATNTWHPEYLWLWDINNVTLLNSQGEFVWEEEIIEFSNPVGFKANIVSTPLIFNNYWLTIWGDERKIEGDPAGNKKIYLQRINIDGTLGGSAFTCYAPKNLNVTDITAISAKLSWDEGSEENLTWELRYSEAGEISWVYEDALEEKTFYLEGLIPYTVYIWTVRAHCADEQTSEWATQNSFTTETWNVSEINKKAMKVFASGKMLNIINPENRYVEKIQLFDITGKLLYDYVVNSTGNLLLPTTFLSEMVLFVNIIGRNEFESHKIVFQ